MTIAQRRAVFFDRDGVLNESLVVNGKALAPLTLESFIINPDAAHCVSLLRDKGYLCLLVTNQPEIARGNVTQDIVDTMHSRLLDTVPLDGVYVCPHDPTENCPCHKPKPGLLLQAALKYDIDLTSSYLVGDRWRDIGAGNAAGCYSILLKREYSGECQPQLIATSLSEATAAILSHHIAR